VAAHPVLATARSGTRPYIKAPSAIAGPDAAPGAPAETPSDKPVFVALAKAFLSITDSASGPRYSLPGATAAFGDYELLAERVGRLEGQPPVKPRPARHQIIGTAIGAALLLLGLAAVSGLLLDIWFAHG
jgi:hypothetical protein